MPDGGVTFAEFQSRKNREEIRKSHDAFEDDLSLDEYTAATNAFVDEVFGVRDAAGASVGFSNEKDRASDFHAERSQRAQRADEARQAPLTTNVDAWMGDPSHFDFPGVDTPADTDLTPLFD